MSAGPAKIANYRFTTLIPEPGVVEAGDVQLSWRLPGLIREPEAGARASGMTS